MTFQFVYLALVWGHRVFGDMLTLCCITITMAITGGLWATGHMEAERAVYGEFSGGIAVAFLVEN